LLSSPQASEDLVRREAWKNVGFQVPSSTVQTLERAKANGDTNRGMVSCLAGGAELSSRWFRQIDKAATSVVLNIAEGNGRRIEADHRQFLELAESSVVDPGRTSIRPLTDSVRVQVRDEGSVQAPGSSPFPVPQGEHVRSAGRVRSGAEFGTEANSSLPQTLPCAETIRKPLFSPLKSAPSPWPDNGGPSAVNPLARRTLLCPHLPVGRTLTVSTRVQLVSAM
jgi:hypothetical protein